MRRGPTMRYPGPPDSAPTSIAGSPTATSASPMAI
jgi:hypothetical protein